MAKVCKHGEVGCGEYYDCGRCSWERKKRIWREMSPERRAYDRHFAPALASALDKEAYDYEPQGCSCHISPPCGFCCSDVDDEPAPTSTQEPRDE